MGARDSRTVSLAGLVLLLLIAPRVAHAQTDVLVMPFIGATFGGTTDFVDLEDAAGQTKFLWGAAIDVIKDAGIGVEVDLGYSPGFFEQDEKLGLGQRIVPTSSVTSLMGNAVLAVPNSVARYTLRPYVSGGLGLLSVSIRDFLDLLTERANLLGMNAGGGAIGFVNDTTGVRWDIRYFRNLTKPGATVGFSDRSEKLSYWRGSIALVIRY